MSFNLSDLSRIMRRSTWQLDNSTGGQIGAGLLTISGGVFDFKDTSARNPSIQRLRYGALGGGFSVGVEWGASGSAPGLPSISSAIYTLPASGGRLTFNDFRGHFTAFDIGVNCGVTGGVTLILFGANNQMLNIMNTIGSIMGPIGTLFANSFAILPLHKACVITAGMSIALTPSAGVTIFRGQVG